MGSTVAIGARSLATSNGVSYVVYLALSFGEC